MFISAFLFSAMQVTINLTGKYPLMEQVFFRNIVNVVICYGILRKNGLSLLGAKKDQPLLFMRSGFGFLGLLTLFYAASRATQADVTILSKLSPFLITLWAFLFLKEKIAKIQVPALIIALCGALFVARPGFHSNMMPLAMAFLCSIFSSITYTLLAYSKDKVNAITIIMHFATFCTVISLPFLVINPVMPGFMDFLLLCLTGVFGSFGQMALTYAYQMAPASEVSVYNYSGILFSMILGFIVLGERVPLTSFFGGALVIAASALAYRYSKRVE